MINDLLRSTEDFNNAGLQGKPCYSLPRPQVVPQVLLQSLYPGNTTAQLREDVIGLNNDIFERHSAYALGLIKYLRGQGFLIIHYTESPEVLDVFVVQRRGVLKIMSWKLAVERREILKQTPVVKFTDEFLLSHPSYSHGLLDAVNGIKPVYTEQQLKERFNLEFEIFQQLQRNPDGLASRLVSDPHQAMTSSSEERLYIAGYNLGKKLQKSSSN